jgi:hypothetical protein
MSFIKGLFIMVPFHDALNLGTVPEVTKHVVVRCHSGVKVPIINDMSWTHVLIQANKVTEMGPF